MRLNDLFLILLSVASAHADTLTVTSTGDSGPGSLRDQIAAAASGDTIDITATGTITLTAGKIVITGRDLIISGPGADSLTITTNATTRALEIVNSQCAISGLSFDNCTALPGDIDTGGAIAVDNFTQGGSSKVTTISDCSFTNNRSGWGGAVDIFNGGLTMDRCSFSGNSCTGIAFGTNGGGGALSLGATMATSITNCTFSDNRQDGMATDQPGGGAIYNYGSVPSNPPPVTIEHCSFVENVDSAGVAGAIKGNFTGSYQTMAKLKNCLLVNNQAPLSELRNFAGDPSGPLTTSYGSLGGNVTDELATSAEFMTDGSDIVSSTGLAATVAPALALNGGSTRSHAIMRGSPAQRAGLSWGVATDQRGAARHALADAGAFELIEPELSVSVSSSPLPEAGTLDFGSTPIGAPLVKTITITNSQTSAFTTGPLVLGGISAPAGYSITGFPSASLGNGQSASFDLTLTAVAPGLITGPMKFTGNDSFAPELATTGAGTANLHTFNLSGLVTDTIERWRQQYFGAAATNSGDAADTANPSGDGIPNLIKYALGLAPTATYPPSTGIDGGFDTSGYLTMTVTKNPAATDLVLAIEIGDLGEGSPWNTAETIVLQDTATILQARDKLPVSAVQRRFMRLSVTRP